MREMRNGERRMGSNIRCCVTRLSSHRDIASYLAKAGHLWTSFAEMLCLGRVHRREAGEEIYMWAPSCLPSLIAQSLPCGEFMLLNLWLVPCGPLAATGKSRSFSLWLGTSSESRSGEKSHFFSWGQRKPPKEG